MLLDVEVAISDYGDLALGVRQKLTIGAAQPSEVWIPVVVAGAADSFALKSVVVRSADKAGGQVLGAWHGSLPFVPVSKSLRTAWARGLGPNYAFACVRADVTSLDSSQPSNLWLVVEAEVECKGGETRRLASTTFLDISALPTPDGWHAGDTHIHSTESDGMLGVDETVGHAKGASGLAWMVMTDHAKLIPDWHGYVGDCERAQHSRGVLVCAGAEFAGHRGLGEGHALGYFLRTDAASQLPPADESPQDIITSIRAQGPSSFAAVAHPYNWRYDWPDWNVTGFRAIELATGGGPAAQLRTRDRWFRLLREDLRAWSGASGSVDFVVGLASTDSHSIPLSVMPGERHLNWVHTGTALPPTDAASLFSLLRAGRCVASCGGDFGALFVDGSGPGLVCTSHGSSPLTCEFSTQSRSGHRLDEVRLRGPRGVLGRWGGTDDDSFAIHVEPPLEHSFYVAEFAFSDSSGRRWEVWANPVWVRRA